MLDTAKVRFTQPIRLRKHTSSTGLSGVVDTITSGKKAQRALIRFCRGSGASTLLCKGGHCSASGTLMASATAFSTVLSTTTTSNTQVMYDVNLAATKRFIRVKASAAGSGSFAVFVDFFHNAEYPTATAQGATSLTRIG